MVKKKILHDKNIKYLHLKSSSFYQKLINDLKNKSYNKNESKNKIRII